MNPIQLKTNDFSATKSRTIHLCFYEPRAANEHWLNRLVASVGSHYVSHVEIMFEDDMAASIFADEAVFFENEVMPIHTIESKLLQSVRKVMISCMHSPNVVHNNKRGSQMPKCFVGPL